MSSKKLKAWIQQVQYRVPGTSTLVSRYYATVQISTPTYLSIHDNLALISWERTTEDLFYKTTNV
jgi:hypothetical protein